MSLLSLVYDEIAKCNDYVVMQAMYKTLNKIDYEKLQERILTARTNPDIPTKCVLLEYSYTSWEFIQQGIEDKSQRVHNTDVLVHTALNSPGFQDLANKILTGNNPKIHVYTRRRINADGNPDFHKYQLVLSFDPYAYQEEGEIVDGSE
jgi:hypothetical protein